MCLVMIFWHEALRQECHWALCSLYLIFLCFSSDQVLHFLLQAVVIVHLAQYSSDMHQVGRLYECMKLREGIVDISLLLYFCVRTITATTWFFMMHCPCVSFSLTNWLWQARWNLGRHYSFKTNALVLKLEITEWSVSWLFLDYKELNVVLFGFFF